MLLEKRNDPKYNSLYSGKKSLDNDYSKMMDHDRDLKAQLDNQTKKLYSKYRELQAGKNERRKRRDRMLKGVLQKASFENHFMGNVLPKNLRGNPQVELGKDGIEVRDLNKEIKEQKLMGMKNLKDLKNLNIGEQISKRERMLKERNEEFFKKEENHFTSSRERNLEDTTPKMVKHVRGVGSQSFLLRNDKKESRKGSFKSERGLRQVRRHHRKHRRRSSSKKRSRKLAVAKKTDPKAKKTKAKAPPKKKPPKKVYTFDWRSLKWKLKKKYKYQLITSLKDLKFWRSMGIKIKKHKVSLFYKWENNRKHMETQEACVLTARFSPLLYFYDVKHYYAKATFKSNCENYTVEKLFRAYYNYGRSFIIYIGKMRFSVKYSHRRYRRGWYNYQYLTMKTYPRMQMRPYNPYVNAKDYIKFQLAPETALKWKKKRLQMFLKYQHHYPTRSDKHAHEAYKKDIIKKNKKRYGRRLQQVDAKKPKKEVKTPKERNLKLEKKSNKDIDREENKRKLRYRRRRRIHWRHRWQYIWLQGYRNVQESQDVIIPRNSSELTVPRSTIKRLWNSTKYLITCHGHSHRKKCRI